MKRLALAASLAFVLVACAAGEKGAPKSPESAATQASPSQAGQPSVASTYAPAPTPSAGPPASVPPPPPMTPGTAAGVATPRQMALTGAQHDVEASQRELDVAAGDCTNACRALGSMDRAAGRLCGLVQEPSEQQRCDDAKQRVYSARDRVKSTCGSCPDGTSVDRRDPVPASR